MDDPSPAGSLSSGSADDNADVAAGFIPRSLLIADGTHMIQTAHDAVAAAVETNITAVEAL